MRTPKELIQKYNKPGPRYTSYPPVPFWQRTPTENEWLKHLSDNYDPETGIDLYVHVPFCESLCYYCGCNRTITKNHGVEDPFLNVLLEEWELYKKKLNFIPKINSLHFGGGTPTFLSPENLDTLISKLLVNRSTEFIGSIEIDPRTCKREHLDVMAKHGIKRVSLGIQDFSFDVQKHINRYQPESLVQDLMNELKTREFSSVNFDLIYGLPGQTLETIDHTIQIVAKMKPDLIAFYSYAHLPEKIKNQKLIPEHLLPDAELKRELYESGKEKLIAAGYEEIGMDHFALPGSYLYEARKNHALHRNFMGYVDKKSGILLGLGPTSISDSSISFAQNEKDLKKYEERVQKGELPIEKGHVHSARDLLIQELILDLMCDDKATVGDQMLPHWDMIVNDLSEFAKDGIIEMNNDEIHVTETGKAFVRNVAMAFDYHLRDSALKVRFSQTI